MSSKKSFSQKKHEAAKLGNAIIEPRTDSSLSKAIRSLWDEADLINQEGKFGLSRRNLITLLAKHIDLPFNEWHKKYSADHFEFSALIRDHGSRGTLYFDKLFDKINEQYEGEADLIHRDLAPTCSSLIYLGLYCVNHTTEHEVVIEVCTEIDTETGNAKTATRPANSKLKQDTENSKVSYLDAIFDIRNSVISKPYCQLCPDLTESSEEFLRLQAASASEIDNRDKKLLATTELRIRFKGHSEHYCSRHTPRKSAKSEYGMTHKKRRKYYAFHTFLKLARQSAGVRGYTNTHIMRAACFLLADACTDQLLIDTAVSDIYTWYSTRKGGDDPDPPLTPIQKTMEQIIENLNRTNNKYAELATAIYRQPGELVYQTAKSTGALPDRIENLIFSGFLYNPFFDAIRRGQTLRGLSAD